ncbi:hypothetical protein TI10_05380 [Photorhabdus luminescens subsp. luminescens]|uniref:Uncharacterized protein n=1 Tax=Photorhabdus luminescens TaxID=29488 RepID=A0A1G5Q1F0_PHOLU|nr:YdaS family helix-turn-helix protein [Photorhabdus luminescens]KMW73678.1 hypothetical protein TI10_05380 [Photorhabdus luminescens subsp. luminescens]SCZ55684.1 hypothetical protein SAMN02982990_00795 [Photorhabdus luminescens]
MKLNDYISNLKRGEAKLLLRGLGYPVPPARCFDIENATNGKVTRQDLRPHDWQKIWPEINAN